MKTDDRLYLVAVLLLAAVFVTEALRLATPGFQARSAAHSAVPTTGEPRDVDMERLRDRIRRGELSDRPAAFARPVEDR